MEGEKQLLSAPSRRARLEKNVQERRDIEEEIQRVRERMETRHALLRDAGTHTSARLRQSIEEDEQVLAELTTQLQKLESEPQPRKLTIRHRVRLIRRKISTTLGLRRKKKSPDPEKSVQANEGTSAA